MPMFGAAQKKKPQRASTVSALDLLGWAERVGTIRVWQMGGHYHSEMDIH